MHTINSLPEYKAAAERGDIIEYYDDCKWRVMRKIWSDWALVHYIERGYLRCQDAADELDCPFYRRGLHSEN